MKLLSYDPEYIKELKELFGDDYEKYLPSRPTESGRDTSWDKFRSKESSGFAPYDISAFGNDGNPHAGDIPEPDPEELREPDDFNVSFDFDREYRDVPENRPLRQRRERRSGCLGGVLFATFIICASLLSASLLWLAATDVLGFGRVDEPVNISVPKDFTIDGITDVLHDSGIIKYKFLFKLYAGFSDAEEKIAVGSYTLNKNFDYRAIVHGMMARSKTRVEVKVSIPEGYSMAQIFTLLENNGVCSADELWKTAASHDFEYDFLSKSTLGQQRRLEGFLFPNTYNFYLESTPEQAISKLLSEFKKQFTTEYAERAEELGYSIKEIITIASLIEREAGVDEERAKIASVIYNRLESPNFPRLEIDATIHYAIYGTGQQFSTELDSPYNTYIHEGLPPGPIANPGIESIRAALYPESTDFYFYALGKAGTHSFFKTLSAHEAFVKSDEYGG